MEQRSQFFSRSAMRQPINSTLAGIFLISWCLWIVVYYVNKSVDNVSAAYEQQAEDSK